MQTTEQNKPAEAQSFLTDELERNAFDGLEEANREMAKRIEDKAPTCHFRKMVLEEDDSTMGANNQWWECSVCGHTRAL